MRHMRMRIKNGCVVGEREKSERIWERCYEKCEIRAIVGFKLKYRGRERERELCNEKYAKDI